MKEVISDGHCLKLVVLNILNFAPQFKKIYRTLILEIKEFIVFTKYTLTIIKTVRKIKHHNIYFVTYNYNAKRSK